jgi:hypothetical protein
LALPDACQADHYAIAADLSGDIAAILSYRRVESPDDPGYSENLSGYFFDLTQADCNANCISDLADIQAGTSSDFNANSVPDECEPTLGDVNVDGVIDVDDLMAVINNWGACQDCAADVTGNGVIDVDDLLLVLIHWS